MSREEETSGKKTFTFYSRCVKFSDRWRLLGSRRFIHPFRLNLTYDNGSLCHHPEWFMTWWSDSFADVWAFNSVLFIHILTTHVFLSYHSFTDMAEGNGEIVDDATKKSEDRGDGEKTEDYPKLLEYGLDKKVAAKLDDIYKTGKLAHSELDERALDALKEFPVDGALNVLSQFLESNLEHVSNKSAYLCGVMKTYRWVARNVYLFVSLGYFILLLSDKRVEPVSKDFRHPHCQFRPKVRTRKRSKPSWSAQDTHWMSPQVRFYLFFLKSNWNLFFNFQGQRKYGGPPPNWESAPPGNGCEVFCGKIPKDMYEDELIPLFEKCGTIWDLRLMMDPMTGTNRGYAFITFTSRDSAYNAVREVSDAYDLFSPFEDFPLHNSAEWD